MSARDSDTVPLDGSLTKAGAQRLTLGDYTSNVSKITAGIVLQLIVTITICALDLSVDNGVESCFYTRRPGHATTSTCFAAWIAYTVALVCLVAAFTLTRLWLRNPERGRRLFAKITPSSDSASVGPVPVMLYPHVDMMVRVAIPVLVALADVALTVRMLSLSGVSEGMQVVILGVDTFATYWLSSTVTRINHAMIFVSFMGRLLPISLMIGSVAMAERADLDNSFIAAFAVFASWVLFSALIYISGRISMVMRFATARAGRPRGEGSTVYSTTERMAFAIADTTIGRFLLMLSDSLHLNVFFLTRPPVESGTTREVMNAIARMPLIRRLAAACTAFAVGTTCVMTAAHLGWQGLPAEGAPISFYIDNTLIGTPRTINYAAWLLGSAFAAPAVVCFAYLVFYFARPPEVAHVNIALSMMPPVFLSIALSNAFTFMAFAPLFHITEAYLIVGCAMGAMLGTVLMALITATNDAWFSFLVGPATFSAAWAIAGHMFYSGDASTRTSASHAIFWILIGCYVAYISLVVGVRFFRTFTWYETNAPNRLDRKPRCMWISYINFEFLLLLHHGLMLSAVTIVALASHGAYKA
jgi:hypothetical protein